MKTFSEAIDEITPHDLIRTNREFKDELMANDKFVQLISLMGAQLMEKFIMSIAMIKTEGSQAAAENVTLDSVSVLSVAFSAGMAVGMKMMEAKSNVTVQ